MGKSEKGGKAQGHNFWGLISSRVFVNLLRTFNSLFGKYCVVSRFLTHTRL